MPFIGWNDDLSVGVGMFDDDHKKLIDFINKLHVGLLAGEGISAMSFILDGLVDYTRVHFKREEDQMVKHGYPAYAEHKGEHEALVAKVASFQGQYKNGKAAFSLELMSFLRDWLVKHIQGSDMKYRDFFKGRGVN